MWFIGVEVEQETSAPPPEKNPGSAPVINSQRSRCRCHSATSVDMSLRSFPAKLYNLMDFI